MLPPITVPASITPTQRVRAWWQRLLGPGGLPAAHGGDQTLLLSGLLLTLIVISALAAASIFALNLQRGGNPIYILIALAAGAVYAGAYTFNRRGQYRLAATLTVGITSVAIWASLIGLPGTEATDAIILAY